MDSEYTEEPYEDFLAEVIGETEGRILEEDRSTVGQERDSETDDDFEEDIVDEVWLPRRNKKPLLRNRIVNSLDNCLKKENYNEFTLPRQVTEYKCILEKPKRKSDAGKSVTWINQRVLGSTTDVTPAEGCLLGEARSVNSELMAWDLFITSAMINDIVTHTNNKIQSIINNISSNSNSKLPSHIKLTDCIEIKSFFGLLYARGLLGQNKYSYKQLFMEGFGHPIFGAVTSVKRFGFLHANICFDDCNTRHSRWVHDRFAAVRDIFEQLNIQCSSVLQPGDFMTIDETLYACRTQIGFRQYNKSKPVRYGLLYKSISAVRYPYTFRTAVYSGKPSEEPGPHYIRGTVPIVKSLVSQLQSSVDLTGRIISLDRLYTSIELFEWLQTQGISALGTIDHTRKGIPPEIKTVTERENRSYQVYWNKQGGEMTLNSYVVPTKAQVGEMFYF